jgi:restriction system protein
MNNVYFLIVVLFVLSLFIFFYDKKRRQREMQQQKEAESAIRETFKDLAEKAVRTHARTLRSKIDQLIVYDPYGNADYTKATDHVDYFIREVVFRDFRTTTGTDPSPLLETPIFITWLRGIILDVLLDEARESPSPNIGEVKTGIDYEFFCKRILENADWTVLVTPATGDQGADLIASKAALRVVIQCKFYSSPVGNKAVQEAYAAQAFQQADYAVVVSNSTFTSAAEQLARTNKVYLLHHNSLAELEKVLTS